MFSICVNLKKNTEISAFSFGETVNKYKGLIIQTEYNHI